MRKDIYERVKLMKKDNIKPNYASIARAYDCDYRTVKRYYETDPEDLQLKRVYKSKLDPYKQIVIDKLKLGCSAYSIFEFIKKKGYPGQYSIVKRYCHQVKSEETKKATIRFETNPGLQAQVDWKENFTLVSKDGEIFTINIFLMLLGYSRKKYIELTLDRNQDTLFNAMVRGFKYFGGIPKEIIFDNMKTVVDRSKTMYEKAVINEQFYQFSKDMGFEVWACRPYRPQTKGKVEALARVTSRLKVYNGEFETIDELDEIVKDLRSDLNSEVSQATGLPPNVLWEKEKEYLLPLPNEDVLNTYLTIPLIRKVSKESMIVYNKRKYSLPINYIGKTVEIKEENGKLYILDQKKIITMFDISSRKFNYKLAHMQEILGSDVMKYKGKDEIENFAKKQLQLYDDLSGE